MGGTTLKETPFHIQQNLTVERLRKVLVSLSDTNVDVCCISNACGLAPTVVERVLLPFVRQLGFLESANLHLSELGSKMRDINESHPHLLPEAVHHILFTSHVVDKSKRFSWAYARVVDLLWERGTVTLDRSTISQLVGQVVQDAADTFSVPMEKIAFSVDSMRGVLNWLKALEPAVTEDGSRFAVFKRRYYCPVAPFLWAVDFLYRCTQTPHGVRLRLAPERADQLCKLCILDPSGLNNVLTMAKKTSDFERGGVFDTGTEGGVGCWILLARPFPVGESL